MEILKGLPVKRPRLKAAVFDFDGTLSTLRYGWEKIMETFMIEMIAGETPPDDKIIKEVKEYIDISTGLQTIFQMQWLAETVKKYRRNPNASEDPWWYKAEYNRRLMEFVKKRIATILSGEKTPEDYLIKGSIKFLDALKKVGIDIYITSGTDHEDANNEAEILGLKKYYREVVGAPLGKVECAKEAVLRKLIQGYGLKGLEVVIIGDGKVEITLGREIGAITLGVASDEKKLQGVNPIKKQRLVKAGAHAIVGDFEETAEIVGWLGLQ